QTATFSLQGPKATDVVRSLFGDLAAKIEDRRIAAAKLNDVDVTIMRATHTAEAGFDLLAEVDEANKLREALVGSGAEPVSAETAEVLRIEAGIPRYGIDMDETTVVTETNLDDAISFTKGCYVGQEIIIRIRHRGHVAKKLTGIVFDDQMSIEGGA